MSAAASEARAAAADESAAAEGGALVESAADTHETAMTYDESSRVPWWVVTVWICSMAGFAAYMLFYFYPDLVKWGAP